MRLRRSELSTPASDEGMIRKAASSDADLVFLDLEDAVAPNEKVSARDKVVEALATLDWGRKTRAIRINGLETEYAYQDIIQIVEKAGEYLDIIIVPKVKSSRDVWWVDVLLTQIETRLQRTNPVGLEVLIEEVEAVINVEEIAHSSPRLEALIFGPGDYSASQGVKAEAMTGVSANYPGDVWHYVRNKTIIAARAAGIDAVDGPYVAFKDPEGYRRECLRTNTLGATGKWAIHPDQIGIANEVFSPPQEEVDRARKLIDAYDEAKANGLGAIAVDGELVDEASTRIPREILRKAELIGM